MIGIHHDLKMWNSLLELLKTFLKPVSDAKIGGRQVSNDTFKAYCQYLTASLSFHELELLDSWLQGFFFCCFIGYWRLLFNLAFLFVNRYRNRTSLLFDHLALQRIQLNVYAFLRNSCRRNDLLVNQGIRSLIIF